MQTYNKLVRDNVPERIAAKGEAYAAYIATEQEYREKLQEKFLEEWNEFLVSKSPEELADILEVVDALAVAQGVSWEEILQMKQKKKEERGGFVKRIILEQS